MPIEQRDGYRLWEGGPVPKGVDGITVGSMVIVRDGKASPYLLRHELVHVRQWRRYGAFGFSVRYLGSYLLWRLRGKGHRGGLPNARCAACNDDGFAGHVVLPLP